MKRKSTTPHRTSHARHLGLSPAQARLVVPVIALCLLVVGALTSIALVSQSQELRQQASTVTMGHGVSALTCDPATFQRSCLPDNSGFQTCMEDSGGVFRPRSATCASGQRCGTTTTGMISCVPVNSCLHSSGRLSDGGGVCEGKTAVSCQNGQLSRQECTGVLQCSDGRCVFPDLCKDDNKPGDVRCETKNSTTMAYTCYQTGEGSSERGVACTGSQVCQPGIGCTETACQREGQIICANPSNFTGNERERAFLTCRDGGESRGLVFAASWCPVGQVCLNGACRVGTQEQLTEQVTLNQIPPRNPSPPSTSAAVVQQTGGSRLGGSVLNGPGPLTQVIATLPQDLTAQSQSATSPATQTLIPPSEYRPEVPQLASCVGWNGNAVPHGSCDNRSSTPNALIQVCDNGVYRAPRGTECQTPAPVVEPRPVPTSEQPTGLGTAVTTTISAFSKTVQNTTSTLRTVASTVVKAMQTPLCGVTPGFLRGFVCDNRVELPMCPTDWNDYASVRDNSLVSCQMSDGSTSRYCGPNKYFVEGEGCVANGTVCSRPAYSSAYTNYQAENTEPCHIPGYGALHRQCRQGHAFDPNAPLIYRGGVVDLDFNRGALSESLSCRPYSQQACTRATISFSTLGVINNSELCFDSATSSLQTQCLGGYVLAGFRGSERDRRWRCVSAPEIPMCDSMEKFGPIFPQPIDFSEPCQPTDTLSGAAQYYCKHGLSGIPGTCKAMSDSF